ncbi:MAG TPA: glycosyltransferase [Vicinamibacteria bacterium]|nr:glycosyltransferase [Vicinamibacteria bacterium]
MNAPPRVVVWSDPNEPAWRSSRTRRALDRMGIATAEARGPRLLAEALQATDGGAWLVRAGAWPIGARWEAPPPSATARPLLALGAVDGESPPAATWRVALDLERGDLPAAFSVYLEAPLLTALRGALDDGLGPGLLRLRDRRRPRVVRASALDVGFDERLRVAEVVTSLQQGGAERIAVDLAGALPAQGLTALLAVMGAPTRQAIIPPRDTALLEWNREQQRGRAAPRLAEALVASGIDVVHAHLLEADDVRALARTGIPVAVTLHNQRPGWPAGTASLRPGDASLLIACSRAVQRDVAAAGLSLPSRTAWNGIAFDRFAPTQERDAAARAWRARLGFGPDDFVMLALANARPQKRLERLPGVLGELRAAFEGLGSSREARLVVAGSPSAGSAASTLAQAELERAVERFGLGDHVRTLGSVSDAAGLLRAADVLVSASAHEGLSLALLEALASERPVVATAVGGAPEVAARTAGVSLVGSDAPAADFVPPLLAIARGDERPALAPGAARHFSLGRMAADHARLLRSVASASGRRRGDGLLLVANNVSTGGAQSSAIRLLLELRRRGRKVRAAVIQEQIRFPTRGRRALEAAGVPVLAVPPPEELEPAAAVSRILESIEADAPQAIALWNVIAVHKLLLADTLLDVPVFDVSPGEMYFEALERYFARPRPGLAYESPAEYGARLAGVIVKYQAEAAGARALGAPIHVIPNGIEVPAGGLRGSSNGRVVIGTLARLNPRKRVDRLLRALRLAAPRLPPHVLRIGGAAERQSQGHVRELERLALGLEVEFLGEVEAAAFLDGLDVFALVAEPAGCPNASLEAMARGVAVAATDAGGMSEQIVDGVSGRLVAREDDAGLAEALVELCHDTEKRRRLGQAGRERVAERFSLRAMTDSYEDVLLGGH